VRDGIRFEHVKCYMLEAFNYGEHKYIDVRSRVVVDVEGQFLKWIAKAVNMM